MKQTNNTKTTLNFGIGNIELYLKDNPEDNNLVHCFIGFHGNYVLSQKRRAKIERLRKKTINQIKQLSIEAFKNFSKTHQIYVSTINENLKLFEAFLFDELSKAFNDGNIQIDSITIEGFHVRNEFEPINLIDENSINHSKPLILALSFFIVFIIAFISFVIIYPKIPVNIQEDNTEQTLESVQITFINETEQTAESSSSILDSSPAITTLGQTSADEASSESIVTEKESTTEIETIVDSTSIETTGSTSTTQKQIDYPYYSFIPYTITTSKQIAETTSKETTIIETTDTQTSGIEETSTETTTNIEPETTQETTPVEETSNPGITLYNQTNGVYNYSIILGEITLNKYLGSEESIVIPDKINDYKVTKIGDSCFKANSNITSVTISPNVEQIGETAFFQCRNLSNITIPQNSNLMTIDRSAFDECNVRRLDLRNAANLYFIYTRAFAESKIIEVYLPASLMSISDLAFYECYIYYIKNLSDLQLQCGSTSNGCIAEHTYIVEDKAGNRSYPNDGYEYYLSNDLLFRQKDNNYQLLTYVGSEQTITLPLYINGHTYTPYLFTADVNVILPDGFETLSSIAFKNCKTLTIPGTVKSIGYVTFDNAVIDTVILQEGVETIGYSAFFHSNINNIVIPQSVTSISDIAFLGGHKTRITVSPLNQHYKCINDCLIDIEQKKLIKGNDYSIIPDDGSVLIIDKNAFDTCMFTTFTIPSSVTQINRYAFCNCHQLKTVYIGETVTTIDEGCFFSADLYEVHFTGDSQISSIEGNLIYENQLKTLKIISKENDYLRAYAKVYNYEFVVVEE